jgi:ABC-type oligopeptide transport system substrate-binding subunit/class 3 adenylate cyclase
VQPPGPRSQPLPSNEVERRPVTILFTDIAGSTAIAERLDPEEWREVVSGAHRRVTDAVTLYGGTIGQLLGDGVLTFFGAPAAHEDDPARAVRAALDIQAAIAAYARELAGYVDDFAMRIGIHTGEVVVGEIGGAAHTEYLAVGDAVNLAARLQSAAMPGKVLVSESIARLVRGAFELADLGEITVKGKAAPVAVFEVVRPLETPARSRGLAVLRSPLVGREAELGALTGALAGLCEGHGGIVALLGEAGIGKSRLVEEAHAWAEANLCQPPHWLEGRALSYGAALPYWTITQLLKADLGLSDGDPEVRARVALRRRLSALFVPAQRPSPRSDVTLSGLAGTPPGRQASSEESPCGPEREPVLRATKDSSLSWRSDEALGTEPLTPSRAGPGSGRMTAGQPSGLALGAEAAELYPYLAHLLGLRLDGEEAQPLASLDSETLKYQVLVCTRRYFSALAERQPLVLVCEDTHWADPSTLDVLGELLALTDYVPLLLLLVGRVERGHGSWRLKQRAETEYAHRYAEIGLRPLGEGDSQRLVANLLSEGRGEAPPPKPVATHVFAPDATPSASAEPPGGASPLRLPVSVSPPLPVSPSLRRLLLDRAEGNPFYLEELVASLVEQGVLVWEGDAWQLKGPIESLRIPDTVHGVILARIDRLEEDVRGTLQMASVIGRSFLYRLLAAVAEGGGEASQSFKVSTFERSNLAGNASPQLDRHLVILQRADLVREKAVRPELEYIFKHSLAQEAAYHSLLLERRREFHRRVGEALETLFPDRREEFYGLLAHHFDRAEQVEKAVHYLVAAGDKARMEDALPEAARFYRRAVERLEAAGDAEGASRAWLKLALVYQADFDFAAAHDAYERGFAWEQQSPHRIRRSPDEGVGLRMSGPFHVNSLDPGKELWTHEADVVLQLFAGLAEVDANLNVVPHAARSWELLREGLCYRIYLRDDVCWTDGSPVTAHDFAYAWLRNLDPQVAASEYPACLLDDLVGARASRLGQLRDPKQVGVRALDDFTLEVRLEQPLAYFPYLLAHPITFPLPRRAVERWGEAWWQPEHILSNGAFRLARFEPGHIILEHNRGYFGEATGNLARAEYLSISDDEERLERFRRGDLDNATELPQIPEDLASCLQHLLSLTAWCLVLSPQPPLDDPRLRRAVAMAMDRQSLAERWGARPATGGLVPPGMPGHTPGLAVPYDPGEARRLLAEAGYPEGHGLPPLCVGYARPEYGAAIAQSLREALPLDVDLHQFAMPNPLDDVSGSHLLFWGWSADLPDPDNFLRHFAADTLCKAGWQDPEMGAWLERAAYTADQAGRMALYRQTDRRLVAEQVLVVPLGYGSWNELSQPWVRGARRNKMGFLSLKDVVVEKHASA